jgi:hypothetical protein
MVKRKPGSNAYEPDDNDRKQVLVLVGMGLTHDQIAKVMGISDESLRKHFREELDTGEAKLNAKVAQNLFNIATSKQSGCVPAAIFWMKTRAGWREKDRVELTGADGGPIQIEAKTVEVDDLDEEQLDALEMALLSVKDKLA